MPARIVVVIFDLMIQILTIVSLMEMNQDDAKGDVYLTTLGVVQIYIIWNSILVSSELGSLWNDAVVAWFHILHWHLLRRTEENYDDTFIRSL